MSISCPCCRGKAGPWLSRRRGTEHPVPPSLPGKALCLWRKGSSSSSPTWAEHGLRRGHPQPPGTPIPGDTGKRKHPPLMPRCGRPPHPEGRIQVMEEENTSRGKGPTPNPLPEAPAAPESESAAYGGGTRSCPTSHPPLPLTPPVPASSPRPPHSPRGAATSR